jgi:hypothetical protein
MTAAARGTALVAMGAALSVAVACARPKPVTVPPPPPALEVPVVPPRVLAPSPVEPEPTAVGAEPSTPGPRRPVRPRPRPEGTPGKPEQPADSAKTETPPDTGPVDRKPVTPAPDTVLQTPQTADDTETDRKIREGLARASRDLARVDAAALGRDARAQYETARRFIDQAEGALRVRNYMFAQYLADKAETLARGLRHR